MRVTRVSLPSRGRPRPRRRRKGEQVADVGSGAGHLLRAEAADGGEEDGRALGAAPNCPARLTSLASPPLLTGHGAQLRGGRGAHQASLTAQL